MTSSMLSLVLFSSIFLHTWAMPTEMCGCAKPSSVAAFLVDVAEVTAANLSSALASCSDSCWEKLMIEGKEGHRGFHVVVTGLEDRWLLDDPRDHRPWACGCVQLRVPLTTCHLGLLPVFCDPLSEVNFLETASVENESNGDDERMIDEKRPDSPFALLAVILGLISAIGLALMGLKTWCEARREREAERTFALAMAAAATTDSLVTVSKMCEKGMSMRDMKQGLSKTSSRTRLLSLNHFSIFEKK